MKYLRVIKDFWKFVNVRFIWYFFTLEISDIFFLLSCDIYYYESFSSVAIFNTMNLKKKKFNRYLYQGSIRLFIIKINRYTILFLADVYCQIAYFVYYNKYTSYIRRIGDFFFFLWNEFVCKMNVCTILLLIKIFPVRNVMWISFLSKYCLRT